MSTIPVVINGPPKDSIKKVESWIDKTNFSNQQLVVQRITDSTILTVPWNSYRIARGLCVIFNFQNFHDPKEHEFRTGSDQDSVRLYKTIQELGYNVISYSDLTLEQLSDALREIKSITYVKYGMYCALWIIVMSHGGDEKDKTFFYLADGQKYFQSDLIEPFTNVNCPGLAGKPRKFFFQICRGKKEDQGTNITVDEDGVFDQEPCDGNDSNVSVAPIFLKNSGGRIDGHLDQNAQKMEVGRTGKKIVHKKMHKYSDILIVHSTIQYHRSYRTKSKGSYFMRGLVYMLCHYAATENLHQILSRVIEFVKESVCAGNYKQVPSVVYDGCTKELYFIPFMEIVGLASAAKRLAVQAREPVQEPAVDSTGGDVLMNLAGDMDQLDAMSS